MAIARFKDLVLDAVDAQLLGRFWAQALRLDWHVQDNGDGWLSGPRHRHTIWINQVPEPVTVKNRVHFDVYATSLAELEAIGATVVGSQSRWTVMADPEGTLFCAFLRDKLPPDRLHGLVVDSADPVAIAGWWAGVFDAPVEISPQGWATLSKIPGIPTLTMDFNPVPEPKIVKNRVHWDVEVTDVGLLVDAGATVMRPRGSDLDWHVLADPQGNEFCAFN
jgi:hypothetical protein